MTLEMALDARHSADFFEGILCERNTAVRYSSEADKSRMPSNMAPDRKTRPLVWHLVRRLLAALAAVYLLIVCALWYWQASFIFQPSPDVNTTPSDLGVKFEK